ncbi:helix-turn-helix transcriptional regulator [Anaerococcus sp. mt242]|mgnify:CR=1 FL=1|uniref:helix-turn-helix domain-containing protein n=1 Tax=Anaerococcus sp. mt242 TaxID=2661917 RepID=UPI0019334B40|nr:helix-turn-helix transcriptional regulator [Anaerococcus sp. mt242]MBM0046172.1 helix-turn-helix transcriptional regulator [Anaerococcus sp. mt242]
MNQNYKNIGNEIKRIRKSKNMSQRMLAELSGINIESVRRIENNYNNPRLDSFIEILDALDIDFEIVLMKDKGSSWEEASKIIRKIDYDLENTNFHRIEEKIKELISIRENLSELYYTNLNQYIYYYKGIYEKEVTGDYDKFKEYLLLALNLKDEDLKEKSNRSPNTIGSRILINLSEYYLYIDKIEKCKEILDYLMDKLEKYDPNYINLMYNLARYYYVCKDYNNSIIICDKSLAQSSANNDFKRIMLFYYLKGLSMYQLNDPDYEIELNKSLDLCSLLLKDNVRILIEKSIKNIINAP